MDQVYNQSNFGCCHPSFPSHTCTSWCPAMDRQEASVTSLSSPLSFLPHPLVSAISFALYVCMWVSGCLNWWRNDSMNFFIPSRALSKYSRHFVFHFLPDHLSLKHNYKFAFPLLVWNSPNETFFLSFLSAVRKKVNCTDMKHFLVTGASLFSLHTLNSDDKVFTVKKVTTLAKGDYFPIQVCLSVSTTHFSSSSIVYVCPE